MRLTDEAIKRRKRPTQRAAACFGMIWSAASAFGSRPTKHRSLFSGANPSSRKPRESLETALAGADRLPERESLHAERLGEVVATKDSAGGEALRAAMRRWYERQTELGSWRPRYRSKVDAIISTYFEGLDNPRVKLTAAAKLAIGELGPKPVSSVTRSDAMRVINAIKPGIAEQVMAIGSSVLQRGARAGRRVPESLPQPTARHWRSQRALALTE
jgi:hypothetical protein